MYKYITTAIAADKLRKRAGAKDVLSMGEKLAAKLLDAATWTGDKILSWGNTLLPAAGLATGAGLAYALSPKAVASSASDFAQNAVEKASLAESIRDLEVLKAKNKLRKQLRKSLHDRFV